MSLRQGCPTVCVELFRSHRGRMEVLQLMSLNPFTADLVKALHFAILV